MYRGNIVLHVTYSVVYVIQKLHCVARDPLALELYPVWYAYICVIMTNTKLVSIDYVHTLYLNTNIYAIMLKLKLLNIRLNGMFIGFFFSTLKVYYMYWNIEKNISFGMYFSFQAKYVITFPLKLHVYHKNGHRIKKIYSTSNVCILSKTF